MSHRKSKFAVRKPIKSNARLVADVSKFGLNDGPELQKALNVGDLMRAGKQVREAIAKGLCCICLKNPTENGLETCAECEKQVNEKILGELDE